MLQMRRFPTWARKPLWQLFMLIVISGVAAVVVKRLAERHADGIDAVQAVEHVRPAKKLLASTCKKTDRSILFGAGRTRNDTCELSVDAVVLV